MTAEKGTQIPQIARHQMNEIELLRLYEPVIRFTEGEMFFPCAVDDYLIHCALWQITKDGAARRLATPGALSVDTLANYADRVSAGRLYLQFVAEPLDPIAYQRWRHREDRPRLLNPNRLERVSLISRILDGMFDASLVVRGRVPGGTAAQAEVLYRGFPAGATYYARVLHEAGYTILHYIYFYAMNDWRSSFHGVNDHESDWEQVFVYLSDGEDGAPLPLWVAYASHDFSGDDLRRRWDDPALHKVGDTHPVVYVGAGSHASYFAPGEYLMRVEPAFLEGAHRLARGLDHFWSGVLRQSGTLGLEATLHALFSVPFVDYARGNGRRIGYGGDPWALRLVSDHDAWINDYRGLWGLDTQDPMGGERAPSGPKYNRDGTIRLSWRDPLAWAGLDKVLPPRRMVEALQALLTRQQEEAQQLEAELIRQRKTVRDLQLEVDSLSTSPYLSQLLARRTAAMHEAEGVLHDLSQRLTDLRESQDAGLVRLAQLQRGDFGDPHSHIRRAHMPEAPIPAAWPVMRYWAAVSGGLLFIVLTALVVWRPPEWPLWLVIAGIGFGAVEAMTQRRLLEFLLGVSVFLAVVTSLILLVEFWWQILVLILAALVLLMIRDNLSEISDS